MLHARPPSPSELSVAPPASRRLRPLPLVVEPSASSSADLSTAIGANGAELNRLLRVHGALLFRNWRVPDTASFAAAAGAMRTMGLSSMADYAPAEPGRDERVHLEGATVWHTNELRRSGNYWAPEVVPHTENFYALERPACVAFFCEGRPPWVGGETALFDGVAAFASLPPRLRAALAQPATVRRHHSLRRLRTRHGEAIDARLGALAARDGAAVQLDGLDGGTVCLTLRRTACGGEGVSFNFGELSGCAAARPATLRFHERGSLLATFSAPSCRRGRLLNK